MRVVSHPEAGEELEAAALWYEERQPGLGDDFLDQLGSMLGPYRRFSGPFFG